MRRFFKLTGIVAVNILFFLFLCLLQEFGFGMKCPSAAARIDASSFLETLLNPGKYNHLHYEVFNAGADGSGNGATPDYGNKYLLPVSLLPSPPGSR